MKLKNASQRCVRENRNELQIERCKSLCLELGHEFSNFSRIIQLAGNEVRMKILLLIREEGRLCVCDLSDILNMKIPAVSQHLRKLRDAELLHTQREGTVIYYLMTDTYSAIVDALLDFAPIHYTKQAV